MQSRLKIKIGGVFVPKHSFHSIGVLLLNLCLVENDMQTSIEGNRVIDTLSIVKLSKGIRN